MLSSMLAYHVGVRDWSIVIFMLIRLLLGVAPDFISALLDPAWREMLLVVRIGPHLPDIFVRGFMSSECLILNKT